MATTEKLDQTIAPVEKEAPQSPEASISESSSDQPQTSQQPQVDLRDWKALKALSELSDKVDELGEKLQRLGGTVDRQAARLVGEKMRVNVGLKKHAPQPALTAEEVKKLKLKIASLRRNAGMADEDLMRLLFSADDIRGSEFVRQERKKRVMKIKDLISNAETLRGRLTRQEHLANRVEMAIKHHEAELAKEKATREELARVEQERERQIANLRKLRQQQEQAEERRQQRKAKHEAEANGHSAGGEGEEQEEESSDSQSPQAAALERALEEALAEVNQVRPQRMEKEPEPQEEEDEEPRFEQQVPVEGDTESDREEEEEDDLIGPDGLWHPRTEQQTTSSGQNLRISLPGVKKSNLAVQLDGSTLAVKGFRVRKVQRDEPLMLRQSVLPLSPGLLRRQRSQNEWRKEPFNLEFEIPSHVFDLEAIEAQFEDDTLTLHFPYLNRHELRDLHPYSRARAPKRSRYHAPVPFGYYPQQRPRPQQAQRPQPQLYAPWGYQAYPEPQPQPQPQYRQRQAPRPTGWDSPFFGQRGNPFFGFW